VTKKHFIHTLCAQEERQPQVNFELETLKSQVRCVTLR